MKFIYVHFNKILHTHAFGFGVFVVFVAFFLFAGGFVVANGQTLGPTDSHVVSLYINGQEKIMPTRAETVGDFLNRANIKLNKADLVEPAADTPIDADNFRVSVYHAKPVTIYDGNSVNKIMTPYSDASTIAQKAGYSIYPEDKIQTTTPSNFIKNGSIGEQVIINRATPVMVSLYGTGLVQDRTQAKTVGDYLKENNIIPEQGGDVIPAQNTPISNNLAIFIAKAGKDVIVSEQEVPFETETSIDTAKPINSMTVIVSGKNGRKLVYYEVDSNRQSNKKVLHEVVIEQPIKQMQVRGAKPPNMAVSGDRISWMRAAGIAESDFYAVDFVIGHESGWRPGAVSRSGCTGLGQACPGSKLAAACPSWASDPACQLRFFSGYANGRYGGWQGAYNTWTRQGWW